ncbi:MAG: 3-phosphoshikimate 1-carboxyvinyltransferase [Ethanoligenens sp.]
MGHVRIRAGALIGTVTPPPSKSAAHRGIICAALAKGPCRVTPFTESDDMRATIGAMRALGASIQSEANGLLVDGKNTYSTLSGTIDCLESGSTLRFLIPIAAVCGGDFTFVGRGRLPQRPIGPYLDCLPKAGVDCRTESGLPLTISGALRPGTFTLPGNVSSQFITGLLLALPLLSGNSQIRLTTPLESVGYIELTLDVLRDFGVTIHPVANGYDIPGAQQYQPRDFTVEGDWSQAAFWLAAGALGGPVTVDGMRVNSKQGDKAIIDLLEQFGAKITRTADAVSAAAAPLHGIEIDAAQIPDLVPILAATACFASGTTTIKNAARLRIKESDRLHTIAVGLGKLGAQIEELPDGLVIHGGLSAPAVTGGTIPTLDGAGDHRIVMALSVAAAYSSREAEIAGAEAIRKSYPAFFTDFNMLGGNVDVFNLG